MDVHVIKYGYSLTRTTVLNLFLSILNECYHDDKVIYVFNRFEPFDYEPAGLMLVVHDPKMIICNEPICIHTPLAVCMYYYSTNGLRS